MRVAFDCLGTLLGSKEKYVVMLVDELQKRGHEVVVWSNGYSYPQQAIEKHALKNVSADMKFGKSDYRAENGLFDYAVEDDTNQTWLAANKFIWVHDIPEARGGINALVDTMEKK